MLKIGDYTVTLKDLALVGIFTIVAIFAIVAMLGLKPKPVVLKAPAQPGEVLLVGGQPGSGMGQFQYPRGLAIDSHGDIYVADSRNHRIQKIDGKTGKYVEQFGGFAASKTGTDFPGKLNEPNGVAIGPNDDVYVMDTWNNRIQIFSPKGKWKKTITSPDGFFAPREILVDPTGSIYVSDTGRHRVVKFSADGKKIREWGAFDPKKGNIAGDKDGQFDEPIGLAMDAAGNLYVADRLNFRIQIIDPNGNVLKPFKVDGWTKDQIDMEPHIAIDPARAILYATDGKGSQILVYKLDGTELSKIDKDPAGNKIIQVPIGIAVDKSGAIYVTDASYAKIFKLAPPGMSN